MIGWVFAMIVLAVVELTLSKLNTDRIAAADTTPVTTTIAISTATAANPQATAQSTGCVADLPSELQDCDFHSLYSGASALQPPFNVADSVNIKQWQAAWRQYSELRKLIDIHQNAITFQHGSEAVQSFCVDLRTLVEKPLRYGCSTLQHLQLELLEFKHIHVEQDKELQVILSNILRETEISIVNNTLGTTITHLLPSWARQAPEFRSERCPSQDCFKIGETALDIAMLQIPIDLLSGVRRVQSAIGGTYATKRAGIPIFGTTTSWSRVTTLMQDPRFSDGNSEQWVIYAALLGAMAVFILSALRIGQRPGLLWVIGLSLVILAVSWPYFEQESLRLGNFNMSDYLFGGRR